MELLQLRYFQTVARIQHMTRAAESLNIAQPALSKTISTLEKELGVKLFDRKGKYIELNEYGKVYLRNIDAALHSLDMGKIQINEMIQGEHGEVKLLILSCSSLLPDLLGKFKKNNPNISFKISQSLTTTSSVNDFDLCIQSSYYKLNPDNYTTLLEEEIFLAVPHDHKCANADFIYLNEMDNEDFIALRRGTNFRNITDIFCNSCSFEPNVVFESDSPSTVRGLIKSGLGIGFIPEISWGMEQSSNIKFLHIRDPKCKRYISLSYGSSQDISKASLLFKDFIIDYFNNLKS